MHDLFSKTRKLAQKNGTKKPHPTDAEHGAKHHLVRTGQLKVSPGFCYRVPVDFQVRVCRWRAWNELRHNTPGQSQRYARNRHVICSNLGYGNDKAAHDIAQQNGHKRTHLNHAVTASQLALTQSLRQISKLDRAKQG